MKKRFKNILAKKRKKNGAAVLLCAVILTVSLGTLVGCSISNVSDEMKDADVSVIDDEEQSSYVSNEQEQASADTNKEQVPADADGGQSNAPSDEKEEQILPPSENDVFENGMSSEESYKAVLLYNEDFVGADIQNKKINLKNIKEAVTDDDSITVAASKFAIVDLNNDGENEVVLWIQINGISDYGFEVLKYQEGTVYGYTLPYREFMELKTDGTFIFSGGAADAGIGILRFSETGYVVDKLNYSESQYDSNNELKVQYIANGTPYSEEEFNADMSHQEEKSSVRWYDLTADNVNTVF